jgi:YbgC/YbaW family acyl-CoA thioester hydrolase
VSEFRYPRRVEFAETDLAGIVHFSWYFRYMEEAEHALWRASGMSIAQPPGGVGFPRVASSCDFLAPLHFEDEFAVLVSVAELSTRSIRYAHTIVRGDTVVARGTVTAACVDRHARPLRSVDLPQEIRDALGRWGHVGTRRDT